MNHVEFFKNPEFGSIRVVEIGGEPWLVGKDVALALGYKNPQEAIRDHVDTEDKGVSEILTPGGRQKLPVKEMLATGIAIGNRQAVCSFSPLGRIFRIKRAKIKLVTRSSGMQTRINLTVFATAKRKASFEKIDW